MADQYTEQPPSSGGGSNMQALITPRPSLDFVKSWPKIVELVIRGVCIGLTFCLFISTCAAIDNLINSVGRGFRDVDGAHSTAGWLLFVSLLTMIVQGLIIAAKFLNFGFMSTYELIVFIVNVAIAGLTAGALFCGAIPAAVFAGRLRRFPINSIESSTGAVAAFAFLDLFAFIALVVWLVVARFLLSKMLSYGRSGGSNEEASAPPQEY